MTARQQKLWTTLLVATASLFLTTCRKDITVPNPDFEKLFGTWDWVQSSGGLSGQTISPSTEGYSMTVEYKDNGIYKKYKDGKKVSKMTFKFSQGTSIYSTGQVYLIEYKDGWLSKKGVVSDSFKFGGQDTLFLYSECYDCYTDTYVKQK